MEENYYLLGEIDAGDLWMSAGEWRSVAKILPNPDDKYLPLPCVHIGDGRIYRDDIQTQWRGVIKKVNDSVRSATGLKATSPLVVESWTVIEKTLLSIWVQQNDPGHKVPKSAKNFLSGSWYPVTKGFTRYMLEIASSFRDEEEFVEFQKYVERHLQEIHAEMVRTHTRKEADK